MKITFKVSEEALSDTDQAISAILESPAVTQNPQLMEELRKLQKQSREAIAQVRSVDTAVSTGDPPPIPPVEGGSTSGSQKWGIIFSSYPNRTNADADLTTARSLGLGEVKLYFNKNRYRGVLIFDSRAKAADALAQVEEKFKSASYIRNLEEWCGLARLERNNFISCN